MSIKYKVENAFRLLLREAGLETSIEDGGRGITLLTSQEDFGNHIGFRNVLIEAMSGRQISPKSRVLRINVIVMVMRAMTAGPTDQVDPLTGDVEQLAENHARNVDDVHLALDENVETLASRLSAICQNSGNPDLEDFTCFGVVPMGEVHDPPGKPPQSLHDVFGYTCTVCEAICT